MTKLLQKCFKQKCNRCVMAGVWAAFWAVQGAAYATAYAAEEGGPARGQAATPAYTQIAAAMQVSSTVSGGTRSIDAIADAAARAGLGAVVITDRDLVRWQYGLWPLRRVVKLTIGRRSVFTYGIGRYLAAIASAAERHPGLVMLPGVESAPFYYWKEDIAARRLAIRNWHKHLIAIGLEDADAIRGLPVMGNTAGLALPAGIGVVGYIVFPLIAILAGAYFIFDKRYGYARFRRTLIPTSAVKARVFGAFLVVCGLALLGYGYPYRDLRYDQFSGDRGIMPYQHYIDYVNEKGGMAFWAHPEAEYTSRTAWVDIVTPEHSEALLQSRDYTGFCIFPGGYERVGRPGGIWDRVLNAYCEGARTRPAWAIGGSAAEGSGDPASIFDATRTTLLAASADRAGVLEAIRAGRLYVTHSSSAGAGRLILDEFAVSDGAAATTTSPSTMGEEMAVAASGAPRIALRASLADGAKRSATVFVIRDGAVVKTLGTMTPVDVAYQDDDIPARPRSYYRAEIRVDGITLITNPVFVRRD